MAGLLVTAGVLLSMALMLWRAVKGPASYDRMLAANAFGTAAVALIALLGFLAGDMMFLDIALVYALINFIATLGFLKYFAYRSLGDE